MYPSYNVWKYIRFFYYIEGNINEFILPTFKVALTKPLKRVEWVEVDQISKKDKLKKELSTH